MLIFKRIITVFQNNKKSRKEGFSFRLFYEILSVNQLTLLGSVLLQIGETFLASTHFTVSYKTGSRFDRKFTHDQITCNGSGGFQ